MAAEAKGRAVVAGTMFEVVGTVWTTIEVVGTVVESVWGL